MEYEEMLAQYQENREGKEAFTKGYRLGFRNSNWTEKRNKTLETVLMELIGLEKEWLITNVAYKKRNNADLIQIIMEQRQLLKMLFDNLDEGKKAELIAKVEKTVWEEMSFDITETK